MGNPFLFADRFSGAVVHLATVFFPTDQLQRKMPATVGLTQAFRDQAVRLNA
jgi:hypothetical protein